MRGRTWGCGLFLLLCLSAWAGRAEPPADPAEDKVLRELEEKVTQLKKEVYESKALVHEMEEAVLRGKMTGSKALIVFENEAEGFFAFDRADFYVNGKLEKTLQTKEGETPVDRITVFDGNLPAGDHAVSAKIRYRGAPHKIFSYMKDHIFEMNVTENFEVDYGKTTMVKLVARDRGYFKTELAERLFVEIEKVRGWGAE